MKRSPLFVLIMLAVLANVQPRISFAQDEQTASARKVVTKVAPVYPQMARSLNLSGTVRLEVLVESGGNIKSVQVKGGNPLLVQSVQSAVQGWKWEKADHDTTERLEFHFNR